MNRLLKLSQEVQQAIENDRPLVALESTVIAHGLPYPANLDVARRVLGAYPDIQPGIVRARIPIADDRARVIIANSITLTPGTLLVDLRDDTLYIHWIGVPDGDTHQATQRMVDGFARRLERIFA